MFSVREVMSKASSFLSTFETAKNRVGKIYQKTPPILLDNIQLQLVSDIAESFQNDVTMIPIDDGSQISDNISQNPLTLSFKVQIVGNNHREVFNKIIELRNKRKLVDLYLIKLYKNMAITSIEHTITSLYYTEFTTSLVEVKIAHISKIPAPSLKAKPVVREKTKVRTKISRKTTKFRVRTNEKLTKTKGNEWEGELQSESIKLPGVKK